MIIQNGYKYLCLDGDKFIWEYFQFKSNFQIIYIDTKFIIKSEEYYVGKNFEKVDDIDEAGEFYIEDNKLRTDEKFVLNTNVYFLEDSSSPLIEIIKLGDKEKIMEFIEKGDIYKNCVDTESDSFLIKLCKKYSNKNFGGKYYYYDPDIMDNKFIYEVFKRLIENKMIDINDLKLQDRDGYSLLEYRAFYRTELFKLLWDNNLIDEELIRIESNINRSPITRLYLRNDKLSKEGAKNFIETGFLNEKEIERIKENCNSDSDDDEYY